MTKQRTDKQRRERWGWVDWEAARTASAFLRYLWQRVAGDDCLRSAAALTYLSLFALVPLLTVVFAMFAAMPAFSEAGLWIQDFIFRNFVPATGAEIQAYLSSFSAQARQLTGVGAAFLMVTALTMLMRIEASFNQIWRVSRNRSPLSSFLLYWAVLSFGPLLVGLAFGISTYVMSLQFLLEPMNLFGLRRVALAAAPWLLTSCAFTLLFMAVPNCRVPARHALVGGFVAGLCFEIAKLVFARVMANASYQVIYGAFAALPLFLLWIWLSWVIVLVGAELVHALSSFGGRQIGHIPELVIALAVLHLLWERHREGLAISERELLQHNWLLGRYSLSRDRWVEVRELLLQARLIRATDGDDYLLARDLYHYTLWDLMNCMALLPRELNRLAHYPDHWLQRSRGLLEQLRDYNRQHLDLPLATLFDETTAPQTRPTLAPVHAGAGDAARPSRGEREPNYRSS